MSSKITTPYPLFNDVDGRPLDAGYIYIGEAGKNPEIYPTPVFWDENLTVPAEQPVRTRNGYFAKNGRAGKLYVADADCSITAKNKNKIVVHTDLFADLFFGQKDVVKTVESIADLKYLVPWDGRTIYVKSYYKGVNKGGGIFTFKSELSLKNDGVTIFNGWLRNITNQLLTTDDAGLFGDGSDTNVTVRLQQLISAAKDGFTVKIKGNYKTNRHLVAYNSKDLKIIGVNSDIQGDPDNWTWDTTNIKPDEIWYHPRGILIAIDCPNIIFTQLKITGINRNNKHVGADQWQDGDAGIQCLRCENSKVHNNIISNTYAWGISIEGSKNPKVYNNDISLITIQSGISCVHDSDGGNAYVYNNTINDVGLYGIEFESLKNYNMQCYSNVVDNCYAGTMTLANENFIKGGVYDNTISNCIYAIYPTNLKNSLNQITISSNSVSNVTYGINISDGNGITVKNNYINGLFTRDVLHKFNPNTFIAEVLAPNKFLVQKDLIESHGLAVGDKLYVSNTLITVASITRNTNNWAYGDIANDWFYIIAINENVLNATHLFRHLHHLITAGSRGEVGIQRLGSLKNIVISGNNVSGFQYNLYKDISSTSADYNESVSFNVLTNASIYSILNPVATMGCKYINNTIEGVPNLHRDLIEKGNISLSPFISTKLGVSMSSAGAAAPTTTVYAPTTKRILATTVQLIGASSTSGNLVVTINGWDYTAQNSGSGVVTIASNIELSQGSNTVKVKSNVSDLTYADVFISFLIT
ncbi:right-handed parallel beta-helix repeat-containing protein [Acinetobacter ursingii]|uniref:right-handed parallel beta-helix repeat-containing protein n=1 Tax=Acinetobacter ursingii TaxID=108980 RepID=UPI0032B399A1